MFNMPREAKHFGSQRSQMVNLVYEKLVSPLRGSMENTCFPCRLLRASSVRISPTPNRVVFLVFFRISHLPVSSRQPRFFPVFFPPFSSSFQEFLMVSPISRPLCFPHFLHIGFPPLFGGSASSQ